MKTRKKTAVAMLSVFVVVLAGTLYLSRPASVTIGSEQVSLPESRGKVLLLNTIGNCKKYGSCQITGLSFYWTLDRAFLYTPEGGGVIFSDVAVESLMRMKDKKKAYQIAQAAFDRIQKNHWGGTHYELLYPLKAAD